MAAPHFCTHCGQAVGAGASFCVNCGQATAAMPRARPPGTNGLAIASLTLGLLWVFFIGSILAVILGHIALSQTRRSGQDGQGLALAGLITGYLSLTFLPFLLIFALASPTLVGEFNKATDRLAQRDNLIAYRAAKAYAAQAPRHSFSGFDDATLYASSPELSGVTSVIVSGDGRSLTITSSVAGFRICTLVATVETIKSRVCSS
jgi:hypothetical protein